MMVNLKGPLGKRVALVAFLVLLLQLRKNQLSIRASLNGLAAWANKQVFNRLNALLLVRNDNHEEQALLDDEDDAWLPWLKTLAKLASREIRVFYIPVSRIAETRLRYELEKIKNSSQNHALGTWWLTDRSTQIDGAERLTRVITKLIRSETNTHAFDATTRMKPHKNQRADDHSIFRQLATSFAPPGAGQRDVESTHSNHPVAGASRRVGVMATRAHLHKAGFRMYDESMSCAARDRQGTVGRRDVHGIKDLQHPIVTGKFEPGMVYTLVDQDMYIHDMSKYAGENIVVITPEYDKLAGVGTDSVWYYTISNGQVVVNERVAAVNGSTYKNQRPWNYTENDFIYINHPGQSSFTTYNVHIQYQPATHRKWVWLCRNSTTSLSKAVCDMMHEIAHQTPLDAVLLEKADNVSIVSCASSKEVYLLGLFGDAKAPTFSFKRAYDMGANTSMELDENKFELFSLMGKNKPKGYGVSEVKRTMQMQTVWRPGGLEPLLVGFFGIPIDYRSRPNIMYTRQVGSTVEDVVEEGTAVEAAPNIAGGGPGVADTKSDAAHDAYVTKRMLEFSNKIEPPESIKGIAGMLLPQFIKLVSGESGVQLGSVPLVGREVVCERRTQPLQAARIQRNAELDARDPLPKTNLKSEAAAKASTAPRGITQYDENMAIDTGRVGLLLKEVLKNCWFYQPGNSPEEIAKAIRYLCESAAESNNASDGEVSGMHDTDYSKMDETISKYIYTEWFVPIVLAFVHKDDYDLVKKILAANVNFITLINGELVNTGFKNNSGSGVTTELNTIVSAFVEYVSTCLAITIHTNRLRHNKELDLLDIKNSTVRTALDKYAQSVAEMTHLLWGDFMFNGESVNKYAIPYAVIGPKFGDDGVAPHLPQISDADWNYAATTFTGVIGMKLKVSFSRPEDGTFFLGRHYAKPLESLASYADVIKAVRKLSIARTVDIDKYVMKLRGYWTTDSKTPVISQYLKCVARMYNVELIAYEGIEYDDNGLPILSEEMSQLLATDRDMFYRVANGPFSVTDEDVPMMLEAIAPQVNFDSSADLEGWLAILERCKTWEDLDDMQLPGMDYDPDAEPEATIRVSGPAASLFSAVYGDHWWCQPIDGPPTAETQVISFDEQSAGSSEEGQASMQAPHLA